MSWENKAQFGLFFAAGYRDQKNDCFMEVINNQIILPTEDHVSRNNQLGFIMPENIMDLLILVKNRNASERKKIRLSVLVVSSG
jgi:hypothetical protein